MKKENIENTIYSFNLMLSILNFLIVLFSALTTSFIQTDFEILHFLVVQYTEDVGTVSYETLKINFLIINKMFAFLRTQVKTSMKHFL